MSGTVVLCTWSLDTLLPTAVCGDHLCSAAAPSPLNSQCAPIQKWVDVNLLHLGHCIKVSHRGSGEGCDSHWLGDFIEVTKLVWALDSSFVKQRHRVSQSQFPLDSPVSKHEDANFLALVIFHCFDNSHPSGCEVARHCGFDLYFPSD